MREAFQTAVRRLQGGDLAGAADAVAELRRQAPEHPEVLHLAGVIAFEQGRDAQGEALLAEAARLAPGNPEIPYNHGSALLKRGAHGAAVAAFEASLALAPDHASARNNLGTALRELGRGDEAAVAFRAVLAGAPNHVGAHVNLGQLALDADDPDAARAHFERATRIDAGRAGAWLGLGEALLASARPQDAREVLERAVTFAPERPEGWRLLARARTETVDFEGARTAAERVVELLPDSADGWNNLANACTSLGVLEAAEEALDRALTLDPGHRAAQVNRAVLLELANRTDEALALTDSIGAATAGAAKGASADPHDARLCLVRARCLARRRSVPEAIGEARSLLDGLRDDDDPWLRKEACFALGRLEDQAGNVERAWEVFSEGNRLAGELWYRTDPPPDHFLPGLATLRQVVEDPAVWGPGSGPGEDASPAFLFGFQRSGTTLLDTVLGVHDQVRVMEEQPVLSKVIAALDEAGCAYPEGLPGVGPDVLEEARRRFWSETDRLLPDRGQALVLDKSPLHTVHLALIRRLFPSAPLVLALRHPLDVCLSCFMQDFTMSPFMSHFLTIEGVGRVYRAVFDLWFRAQEALGAEGGTGVHVVRYERLVEDTEAELRALVSHLGLPWSDELLDHRSAARGRGLINTPSYDQVTRPIYQSARYRWRRYRPFLADLERDLAPYIERLGYALDD